MIFPLPALVMALLAGGTSTRRSSSSSSSSSGDGGDSDPLGRLLEQARAAATEANDAIEALAAIPPVQTTGAGPVNTSPAAQPPVQTTGAGPATTSTSSSTPSTTSTSTSTSSSTSSSSIPRFVVNETGRGPQPAHDAAVRLYTSQANRENLPASRVTELQRAMGITADGVAGSGTRAKVASLLIAQGNGAGSELQRQAALEASYYALQNGSSAATWRNYQQRMGGGIPVDGARGPRTYARMRELLATP